MLHLCVTAHLHIAGYMRPTQHGGNCRYYGVNDPVARKMLNRVDTMPKLAPPEDASITTLYVGGLTPVITEDDIRDQFYSYGELQSVKKVYFICLHAAVSQLLPGCSLPVHNCVAD